MSRNQSYGVNLTKLQNFSSKGHQRLRAVSALMSNTSHRGGVVCHQQKTLSFQNLHKVLQRKFHSHEFQPVDGHVQNLRMPYPGYRIRKEEPTPALLRCVRHKLEEWGRKGHGDAGPQEIRIHPYPEAVLEERVDGNWNIPGQGSRVRVHP